MMDVNDKSLPAGAEGAPAAERRSGGDRRQGGRRKGDRSSADLAAATPANPTAKDPASTTSSDPATPDPAPAAGSPPIIRKYHFRSFEDRRQSLDRRTPPAREDDRLSTDEVASLLRRDD